MPKFTEIVLEDVQIMAHELNTLELAHIWLQVRDEHIVPLLEGGWNVRDVSFDRTGNKPVPSIKVAVSQRVSPEMFGAGYLRAVMSNLDYSLSSSEVLTVTLRGYAWEIQGKFGTKAYLKELSVSRRKSL